MHGNQVGRPRSVGDLARDPAWQVTRSAPAGHWITAEWTIQLGARHWRVGLTPIATDLVALIVWVDDLVVTHTRGDEAAVCAKALHWISRIRAGWSPG